MKIDPRIVQIASRYQQARDAYEASRAQYAHAPSWPMLTTEKQNKWYSDYFAGEKR